VRNLPEDIQGFDEALAALKARVEAGKYLGIALGSWD
jgi:hypothetical protein